MCTVCTTFAVPIRSRKRKISGKILVFLMNGGRNKIDLDLDVFHFYLSTLYLFIYIFYGYFGDDRDYVQNLVV